MESKNIRTQLDKYLEVMSATIKHMNIAAKINNWDNLEECFDKICKQHERMMSSIESEKLPALCLKSLLMLEGFLDDQALANGNNPKALNSMKNKLAEIKKQHKDLINKYWDVCEGFETSEDENEEQPLDLLEQTDFLERLLRFPTTPAQKLEILFSLVSDQLVVNDQGLSMHTMPINEWKNCVQNMFLILDLLVQNPNIRVIDKMVEVICEDEPRKGVDYNGTILVQGNLVALLDKIGAAIIFGELYELMYLALAENIQDYFECTGSLEVAAKVALRRVEHIHYREEEVYDQMRKLANQIEIDDCYSDGVVLNFVSWKPSLPENSRTLMDNLVSFIYNYGDVSMKDQAMLCNIYHHALLQDFSMGSLLLVSSPLNGSTKKKDCWTRILKNRAIAQLGLCAFQCGLLTEAYSYLSQLHSCGRVKKLLGQGVLQTRKKCGLLTEAYSYLSQLHSCGRVKKLLGQGVLQTRKKKSLKERRETPCQMHINLKLLEAIHLISAMLLNVSDIAANNIKAGHKGEQKSKVKSKAFLLLYESSSEKQTFVFKGNLPVRRSIKDHVMAATGAIIDGHSQKAINIIESLEVWKLVSNPWSILNIVHEKIKKETMFINLSNYNTYNSQRLNNEQGFLSDYNGDNCVRIVTDILQIDGINKDDDANKEATVTAAGTTSSASAAGTS